MSWIEITDTKTGKVLCDTRVNVFAVTEREAVTDAKGFESYTGRVVDYSEKFTISDSSILSDWLSTNSAHNHGFHNRTKNPKCEICNENK